MINFLNSRRIPNSYGVGKVFSAKDINLYCSVPDKEVIELPVGILADSLTFLKLFTEKDNNTHAYYIPLCDTDIKRISKVTRITGSGVYNYCSTHKDGCYIIESKDCKYLKNAAGIFYLEDLTPIIINTVTLQRVKNLYTSVSYATRINSRVFSKGDPLASFIKSTLVKKYAENFSSLGYNSGDVRLYDNGDWITVVVLNNEPYNIIIGEDFDFLSKPVFKDTVNANKDIEDFLDLNSKNLLDFNCSCTRYW